MTTSSSEPEHIGDAPQSAAVSLPSPSLVAVVQEDVDELSTGSESPPPRSSSPPLKRSGSPPRSSSPCSQQQELSLSSESPVVGRSTAVHVGESSNEVVAEGSEVVAGASPVVPIAEVPQGVPVVGPNITETAVPTSTPERERRSAIPVPPVVPASFTAELLARGETTSHQMADERVNTTGGAGSSTRLSTGQGDNAAGSQPVSSSATLQPTLSLRSALHTYTKLRIDDLAPGTIDSEDLDRQMIKLSGMLDGCDGLDRRTVSLVLLSILTVVPSSANPLKLVIVQRQELESHMHEWLVATFRRCNQPQLQQQHDLSVRP
jgi:hypothetical protein